MLTIGVDLEAEPLKTAMARIQWAADGALVTEIHDTAAKDHHDVSGAAR